MENQEILGVAPWVIITALVTWLTNTWLHRDKRFQEKINSHVQVEISRDDLTLEILRTAREEVNSAKLDIGDMRDEIRKLRLMEQHFYHFHQSLEHLEALLFSETSKDLMIAKRNAKAFLTRMRKLNQVKNTIANEVQRAASQVDLSADEIAQAIKENRNVK